MTKDDIIRMAQEAGLLHESDTAEIIAECGVEIWLSPFDGVAMLGRFAALVAAHEREACAKVCYALMCKENPYERWEGMKWCMDAIRARGQA